jgi:hypothetical protein
MTDANQAIEMPKNSSSEIAEPVFLDDRKRQNKLSNKQSNSQPLIHLQLVKKITKKKQTAFKNVSMTLRLKNTLRSAERMS